MNTPITDEVHERLSRIIRLRLPWLILGLFGGVVASVLVSRFEDILSNNIRLAFFVPVIVYMSDAVGTQTEVMYVRSLARSKVSFYKNIIKEMQIGVLLGAILGAFITLAVWIWLKDIEVAASVGLAMLINVTISPVLALITPQILFKEHSDPALGAGPITTIIQDAISLLIYFLVATSIIGFKI